MKKLFIFLTVIGFAMTNLSCSIRPELGDLVKNMVVQTSKADNINFSNYVTFAIPEDTLGLLSNVTDDTLIVGEYAQVTTAKMIEKMLDAGYEQVDKTEDPDLGINAFILDNQGVFQSYTYSPGFLGFPGYNYPGYWGYGGFGGYYGYPLVQNFSYQTGTMVIELVDLKNRTPDNKFQVVWVAKIGDVYTSDDQLGIMVRSINQAFDQSSYLSR
jgi:hypothetical protein